MAGKDGSRGQSQLHCSFSVAKPGIRAMPWKVNIAPARSPTTSTTVTTTTSRPSSNGQQKQQAEKQESLSADEVRNINLFLKSVHAVVKLSIVDIVGYVNEQGVQVAPVVRRGRIRTSGTSAGNGGARDRDAAPSEGISCCLIGSMPFVKCEIVATVVKTQKVYPRDTRSAQEQSTSRNENDWTVAEQQEPMMIFYTRKRQRHNETDSANLGLLRLACSCSRRPVWSTD